MFNNVIYIFRCHSVNDTSRAICFNLRTWSDCVMVDLRPFMEDE